MLAFERFFMARKILCAVFAVLTALWVAFIFSNSFDNAEQSTEKSDVVYEVVNEAAQSIGIEQEITHHTIRQGGHFVEFFALGILAAATAAAASLPSLRNPFSIRLLILLAALPFSVLIAFTDEYIQTFSEGRVCDMADVLTDSFGALCGIALVVCVLLVVGLVFRSSDKKSARSD